MDAVQLPSTKWGSIFGKMKPQGTTDRNSAPHGGTKKFLSNGVVSPIYRSGSFAGLLAGSFPRHPRYLTYSVGYSF